MLYKHIIPAVKRIRALFTPNSANTAYFHVLPSFTAYAAYAVNIAYSACHVCIVCSVYDGNAVYHSNAVNTLLTPCSRQPHG